MYMHACSRSREARASEDQLAADPSSSGALIEREKKVCIYDARFIYHTERTNGAKNYLPARLRYRLAINTYISGFEKIDYENTQKLARLSREQYT